MTRVWSSTIVAANSMSHVPWYVLGGGSLLLSLTWLYLMMSRRGATKPVSKCVLLSIWAHVILLGCAYLTHCFPVPVGLPNGVGEVRVQWITELSVGDDEPASDWPSALEDQQDPLQVPPEELTLLPEPHTLTIEPAPVQRVLPDLLPEPVAEVAEAADHSESSARPPSQATAIAPAPSADVPTPAGESARVPEPLGPDASNVSINADKTPAPGEVNATPHARAVHDADAEYLFSSTDDPRQAVEPSSLGPPVPQSTEVLLARPDPVLSHRTVSVAASPPSLPERYLGRTAENRRRLAQANGGSLDTEAAVEAGLQWLAQAQDAERGCWDNRVWEGGRETRELGEITYGVKADTAVTGLALLAFLGAGHTHHEGPYQSNVRRGLEFLIRSQADQSGSLAGDASRYVAMYCHGIATLAMSEALIMTDDPQLRPSLIRAVDYTIRSQHPVTGGWRYQPGDLGDTSQFGWQVMALVSADSAGMSIPGSTWNRAQRWLNRVTLGEAGGLACYTPDRPVPSPSMTAEALFCRVFLPGTPRSATIEEAADFVSRYAAQPEARNDMYFSYYATLALYQLQDHHWTQWNEMLTQHLLTSQRAGGELTGSWDPDTKWGSTGGRVYTTAMACLCLETYYRYLPVYELAATRGRAIRQR